MFFINVLAVCICPVSTATVLPCVETDISSLAAQLVKMLRTIDSGTMRVAHEMNKEMDMTSCSIFQTGMKLFIVSGNRNNAVKLWWTCPATIS